MRYRVRSRLSAVSIRDASAKVSPLVLAAIVAVVQTVVIALFGFVLSGRVEIALKERQGAVAAALAMQKVVDDMQDPGKDVVFYSTGVRKIAMYGVDAIRPLILMAAAPGPYAEDVPITGLLLVALLNKTETCSFLKVAMNEQRLIDEYRRPKLIEVYKKLGCETSNSWWVYALSCLGV